MVLTNKPQNCEITGNCFITFVLLVCCFQCQIFFMNMIQLSLVSTQYVLGLLATYLKIVMCTKVDHGIINASEIDKLQMFG